MHTSIPSNWRPLLRALYAFLITIAVLWAMPRNAHAQLYVTQFTGNSVSEYDTKTGALINASFITGLNGPIGLALSGNTLFVVNQGNGTVGEYDATTGAAINANFIAG
jgi:DNA-binding beta-propeller fold protein YncE